MQELISKADVLLVDTVLIDAEAAELLEIQVGDEILVVDRNGHH